MHRVQKTAGLAVGVEVIVAEDFVDLCEGHERMEGDREHVRYAVGRTGTVRCGAASGASTQVVLCRSVEALDRI
jgi:hypothetical protein